IYKGGIDLFESYLLQKYFFYTRIMLLTHHILSPLSPNHLLHFLHHHCFRPGRFLRRHFHYFDRLDRRHHFLLDHLDYRRFVDCHYFDRLLDSDHYFDHFHPGFRHSNPIHPGCSLLDYLLRFLPHFHFHLDFHLLRRRALPLLPHPPHFDHHWSLPLQALPVADHQEVPIDFVEVEELLHHVHIIPNQKLQRIQVERNQLYHLLKQ